LPLARQRSAAVTRRSLSAALNTRRCRLGTVSWLPRRSPEACAWRSLSGEPSGLDSRNGLGTFFGPFSAHRYLDFQGELSQTTLAQGGPSSAARHLSAPSASPRRMNSARL